MGVTRFERNKKEKVKLAEFPIGDFDDLDVRCARHLLNDLGNAQRLIDRHGGDIMFVQDVGWFAYRRGFWDREVGEMEVRKRAHATARAIMMREASGAAAAEEDGGLDDPGWAVALRGHGLESGSSARVSAMIREAEPYLTRTIDDLDQNPFLVNVENGTVDLETGELRDHRRRDYITRQSPVIYNAAARCPQFEKFLAEIMPDEEIRSFLQRWFGYSMTGSIAEQVLTLHLGVGRNGKSVLMDLMNRLMGDYSLTLPFASLLHDDRRSGAQASPDLARLPGARMVTASEPEVGSRFSEGLIKSLTGGEPLTVRHLNRDFFEFYPQFKLTLAANNKPQVRGKDDGIWRRILLVPYRYQIPVDKIDTHLPAKLWSERSGILNWLISGAGDWLESGLRTPMVILDSTDTYRAESDPLGRFLAMAVEDKTGTESLSATMLWKAWVHWCKDNAEEPKNSTWLGRQMSDKGYEKTKVGTVYYTTIQLTPEYKDALARANAGPLEDANNE